MSKISIVLPTYNGEKYIKEAVDSILGQSFTDWELIIVDDCSTDGTNEIISRYEKNDRRISIVHNSENQKLPRSLNIGFEHTGGEYLTWTSDDNIYEPDALKHMVDFLDAHPQYAMVRADMNIIDENAVIIGEAPEYEDDGMMLSNLVGACFLYRRNAYVTLGDYNTDLFCVEDYDYWLRIMECYGQIGNIPLKLYRYRQHADSLTEQKRELVRKQLKQLRIKHLDYLRDHVRENEEDLLNLYLILLDCGVKKEDISEELKQKCPMINHDSYLCKDYSNAIYGAGYYGSQALKLLNGKAAFYIDRNKSLIGERVNGFEVRSLDECCSELSKVNLIVAVSQEKMFSVLFDFRKRGITSFITYNHLEQQIGEGAR